MRSLSSDYGVLQINKPIAIACGSGAQTDVAYGLVECNGGRAVVELGNLSIGLAVCTNLHNTKWEYATRNVSVARSKLNGHIINRLREGVEYPIILVAGARSAVAIVVGVG